MKRILITGANGQIGTELAENLSQLVGAENIVGLDLQPARTPDSFAHEIADVTDRDVLQQTIDKHKVDTVFHLASLLSATGEQKPDIAWHVNLTGLKNVLDIARKQKIKIFWPSSIAVFGPKSPKSQTPQATIIDPNTMYGITKRAGELLCRYYHEKYEIDVRSVRYPGIISYKTEPGGGTTDYAVEIFYEAIRQQIYTCFVEAETCLPMMYMDDAVRATIELMRVDSARITERASYNLAAVSFTVAELVAEIQKFIPEFKCTYKPDFRQAVANSWPQTIDDSTARREWGWRHEFDLAAICKTMLDKLRIKLK